MPAVNTVWYISAILSYRNGSWASAEMRYDNSGYAQSGPDISRLPEIVALIQELGMSPPAAVPDSTVTKLTYRFSVLSVSGGSIAVLGDTDNIEMFGDDMAATRVALAAESNFNDRLLSGGASVPTYYFLGF